MVRLLEVLSEMAKTTSVWIYIIIFFGKMLEVATSTLRIVLINRGIRLLGSVIAMLEILLWLIITSTVLTSFSTDPLKMVVYALAFGCGNFLGSWLDEKLAFGLSSVQVVIQDSEVAEALMNTMREKGYGISSMDVKGIDNVTHHMLVTMVHRKMVKSAIEIINLQCPNAVITVSDVKVQKGGYLTRSSKVPGGLLK